MTNDAKKLTIYGLESCESISLYAKSAFYGTIYAPNADVEMKNSADVFGSIIADTFIQKVAANFHYDADLRTVDVNDYGVRFVIDRWQEQ